MSNNISLLNVIRTGDVAVHDEEGIVAWRCSPLVTGEVVRDLYGIRSGRSMDNVRMAQHGVSEVGFGRRKAWLKIRPVTHL